MSAEAIALASVVGIGLYFFSRSSKPDLKEPDQPQMKVDNKPAPESKTDYVPVSHTDNKSATPISYSQMAIGEKLIEQKFDIGVSNNKWVFMRAPLTGAQAQVGNVAGAITQYRNGQFYWNATGKAVDWNGYEDRKRIIELLRYG